MDLLWVFFQIQTQNLLILLCVLILLCLNLVYNADQMFLTVLLLLFKKPVKYKNIPIDL